MFGFLAILDAQAFQFILAAPVDMAHPLDEHVSQVVTGLHSGPVNQAEQQDIALGRRKFLEFRRIQHFGFRREVFDFGVGNPPQVMVCADRIRQLNDVVEQVLQMLQRGSFRQLLEREEQTFLLRTIADFKQGIELLALDG